MSSILGSESVREARHNLVHIALVEVTSVNRERAVPLASVEAAVGTLRDIVLEQDIGVEEVARAVVTIRINEVLLVELSLGLAGSSADSGVEGALVVELHAVVGVRVGGRVNSSGEGDGGIEA